MFNNNLAKAIADLARSVGGLREAICDRSKTEIILNRMEEMENRIMSKISEFAEKQNEFNQRQAAAIDSAVESVTGLTGDIAELNRKITELQNSPGAITPEDQVLLDQAISQGEALTAKAEAVKSALQALDEQTPPAAPTA